MILLEEKLLNSIKKDFKFPPFNLRALKRPQSIKEKYGFATIFLRAASYSFFSALITIIVALVAYLAASLKMQITAMTAVHMWRSHIVFPLEVGFLIGFIFGLILEISLAWAWNKRANMENK